MKMMPMAYQMAEHEDANDAANTEINKAQMEKGK